MNQFPTYYIARLVTEGNDYDQILGAIFCSSTTCEDSMEIAAVEFVMSVDLEKFAIGPNDNYQVRFHFTDQ